MYKYFIIFATLLWLGFLYGQDVAVKFLHLQNPLEKRLFPDAVQEEIDYPS